MNQVASSGYPLELAIYNAGNNRPEAFLDVTPAVFEDLWRVTCLGGFIVSQQVIKLMLQQQKIAKKQTLLFTGASASLRGKAGFSGFAAGKGALRMLTQSIAREFAPQGIHVAHVLIDGVVEGEKVRTGFPEYINSLGEDGALKLGEIADAYMALHAQGRSAWTQELDLRPYKESY
jgi:NAD(P)-dependent dehydrogenase (short-subunit alcohol dehydrogenase family)